MTEYDEEFWGEDLWGGERPVFSDNGDDLERGFACGDDGDGDECLEWDELEGTGERWKDCQYHDSFGDVYYDDLYDDLYDEEEDE